MTDWVNAKSVPKDKREAVKEAQISNTEPVLMNKKMALQSDNQKYQYNTNESTHKISTSSVDSILTAPLSVEEELEEHDIGDEVSTASNYDADFAYQNLDSFKDGHPGRLKSRGKTKIFDFLYSFRKQEKRDDFCLRDRTEQKFKDIAVNNADTSTGCMSSISESEMTKVTHDVLRHQNINR